MGSEKANAKTRRFLCVECSIFISIRSFVSATSFCFSIYSISYYDYYNNFLLLLSVFFLSCKHVDSIEKELLQVNGHECAFMRSKQKKIEREQEKNSGSKTNGIFYSI